MTTALYYTDSKGRLVEIATMHFPHLKNAAEKLRREADPRRAHELESMDARLVQLAIEYRAKLVEERETADPDRAAEIDAEIARLDAGQ